MKKKIKKIFLQKKKRFLKKITGTLEKPRLSVFRSHKHIYAQLIDDSKGKTLAFSSTLDKNLKTKIENSATEKAAFLVGEDVAKKAKLQNITYIVFDRGNKPYHGRVKQIAEGARQEGLLF
jgi:large subunit ribosomal protein L18